MKNDVRLFRTCLAEEFFPSACEAAETVLEGLHLKVTPVTGAFCCGQVAFNEGLREPARDLARRMLEQCQPGTPTVVLSGSCAGMIKGFYKDLFADDPAALKQVEAVRPWVFEFSQFLVNVLKVTYLGSRFERAVAYHPSCHLMRELGVRDEPVRLLSAVQGIRLCQVRDREECCGFGGLFSVKFPEISRAMLVDKMARIRESGAEVVVSNDCGCLMQIGGGLHRADAGIEARHLAEVLASR